MRELVCEGFLWRALKKIKSVSLWLGIFIFILGLLQIGYSFDIKGLMPQGAQESVSKTASSKRHLDIVTYAYTLSQKFFTLRSQVKIGFDPKKAQQKLSDLHNEVNNLYTDIRLFRNASHLSYRRLSYFKSKLFYESQSIDWMDKSLSGTIKDLMVKRSEWSKEKETLLKWHASVGRMSPQNVEWKAYQDACKTVASALKLLSEKLNPLLKIEMEVWTLSAKINVLNAEIEGWFQALRGDIFKRNAPSIPSTGFLKQFNRKIWRDTWVDITTFITQQVLHIVRNGLIIIAIILASFLLMVFIRRSGRTLDESSRWAHFVKRPVVSSLFICFTLFGILAKPLPPGWFPVYQFAIIVTVVLLAREFFGTTWKSHVINQLAVLLLVTALLRMIMVPRPLLRVIVFFIALAAILFCAWESCYKAHSQESPLVVLGLRTGALILFVALGTEIIGYANFALYLMDSFLLTVFDVLDFWMLYLLASGLVEWGLYRIPASIIKRNAPVVLARIKPLLGIFFSGLLIVSTFVTWQIYTTREEAIYDIFSRGLMIGSGKITLGVVVMAFAALYGSLLVSWSVQSLLLEEVLPRRQMARGVQFAITRLIHYALVFVGFIIALRILGFGLTNLTIIGGALGVGVGFGLQAIVNNFASGLILLFERPIKVGDTIQVGSDMAVIKRLGLRATVVQTLDNAEIVIPNSDLITNKVTNWTLANRVVRVRIPVGVAYGTDIGKVLSILLACAEGNPKVLQQPKPQALFLAFGDSALNFELRVWISEFMESTGEIQSELNRAINEKFRENDIEIPFPQADLHLRSVDREAAESLRGEKGKIHGSEGKFQDLGNVEKVETQPDPTV